MIRVSYHSKSGFTENGVPVRECSKCPHRRKHAGWDPVKHRQRWDDLRFKYHNANRVIVLRQVYHDARWRSW